MPAVVPEDVAAGFQAIWKGSPVSLLVTGGLWFERTQTTATPPYAINDVKEQLQEQLSGPFYIAKFTSTIRIWDLAKNKNTAKFARALASLLDFTPSLVVPNATSLIHCRSIPGSLELTPQNRNAEEVIQAERSWEVWLNATRS